jgi:hypothetical protein
MGLLCDNTGMWNAVPGYEGHYEANRELYAVRSLDRIIVDSRGQYRRLRGHFMAGGNPNDRVILSRNGIQSIYALHEVMEMTFGVQIPA